MALVYLKVTQTSVIREERQENTGWQDWTMVCCVEREALQDSPKHGPIRQETPSTIGWMKMPCIPSTMGTLLQGHGEDMRVRLTRDVHGIANVIQ